MPTPEEQSRALLDRAVQVGQLNLQPVAMSRKEIQQEISLARFYLSERAPRLEDDPDGEYMFLYDGCIVAANAMCHAFGYRSKGEGSWSYGHKMAGPVSSPGLLGRGQQVAVSAVRNPTAGG